MKIAFSKQVYDELDDESREGLAPIPCKCAAEGEADSECFSCDGDGIYYETELSPEDSAAIQENLRRQGVPLGKIGTN